MAKIDQPLPAGGRTREEIAQIEVGHTAVTPRLARALTAAFLITIATVPIVETMATGTRGTGDTASPWAHLSNLPQDVRSRLARAAASGSSLWGRIVSANREALAHLSAFERALDDESVLGRTLRRPAQRLMARWLGSGNERVYPGRRGWLFYRPDVEYVTGKGFLEPAQLERRVRAASEWTAPPQPDPRPAIQRFHEDLRRRGIVLVVMPTPLKPGVHPEMLGGDDASAGTIHNRSFAEFVAALREAGVLVFDPADALAAARQASPQYLATDTHWQPESMEAVAERLGTFIEAHVPLPPSANPDYRIERVEARNVGDTARMLDLPADDPLFPPEAVWLRRVLLADGSSWRPSRTADILLLGDSFTNIYTLESMGWGTSAGLAEQLSYVLRRPVDRLAQNDEGAVATRAMLARDPRRLEGKRVVVYQFAARELAFGDWKVLPLSRDAPMQ